MPAEAEPVRQLELHGPLPAAVDDPARLRASGAARGPLCWQQRGAIDDVFANELQKHRTYKEKVEP